ncbi:hypothetical protein N7470_002921 [Penicillium chermesinum]|nr:hypothetical protein N7470_002921 [Penicillium chermesinum]
MSSRSAIEPLPPDVVAKIKSSTSITDLTGVVIDLVKNSLDANARVVHVSVDFKRGSCIVEDDGDGILPAEFKPSGGLAKAHHTSKFNVPGVYSHRGLFLASLAALSLLTITSRHTHHQETNSVIFHRAIPVARLTPAPPHQSLQVGEYGTSVTVNDLFGNMPVRVKSRALALQKPEELDREWENLKYSLVSVMLANSQLSKLVITDVERGQRIVMRPGYDSVTVDLSRIGTILYQSGMISSRDMGSWSVISATVPDLTVSAAISTVPSPSKRLQFISLDNDPPSLACSMSVPRSNSEGQSKPLRPSEAPSTTSGRTWVRPINKWPMFYIRVETGATLPFGEEGQTPAESEESVQRITDVLEAMISGVSEAAKLKAALPLVGPRATRNTEEAFSDHLKLPSFQRPTVNTSRHFHDWSRVKTAKDLNERMHNSSNTVRTILEDEIARYLSIQEDP